ncbi:hypothetical protein [Enterobacter roggenkampii]|uniref:hypothetical protein n=1 Tax=Enterobacter roggenkampii TaxID=1812935 RepID=UPI000AD7D787|nr:hypothetical protein [Enterobacter roggenkampii]
MSNIDKQALNQEKIEWLNKLADMEYCKSNPGHWLMSLKDTNMLAKLALRSVSLLDELEAAEKRIGELSQKADIYDMLRKDYELHGSLVEFVDWQAKRIAELEAREVKLPELCVGVVQGGHAVMVPYAAGHWFNKTAILEMLADAGINIAAAGKGEAS